MRIRTIKPEFWSHPILSGQSDEVRLAAIGLLNVSDDEGFFLANPALIRSLLWPLDEDSSKARRCLEQLASVDYIEIREHPTHGKIGLVLNFSKHQRVDRPRDSSLKAYFLDESSTNDRRTFLSGMEGNGTGNGKERNTHKVSLSLPPAVEACAGEPEESRFEEATESETHPAIVGGTALPPSVDPDEREPEFETEPPKGMPRTAGDAFRRTPIDLQESLGKDVVATIWGELASTGWLNRHGIVVTSWGAHIKTVGPLVKRHIIREKTAGKGLSPKLTTGPKSVGELLAERIIRESNERNRNGESGV